MGRKAEREAAAEQLGIEITERVRERGRPSELTGEIEGHRVQISEWGVGLFGSATPTAVKHVGVTVTIPNPSGPPGLQIRALRRGVPRNDRPGLRVGNKVITANDSNDLALWLTESRTEAIGNATLDYLDREHIRILLPSDARCDEIVSATHYLIELTHYLASLGSTD